MITDIAPGSLTVYPNEIAGSTTIPLSPWAATEAAYNYSKYIDSSLGFAQRFAEIDNANDRLIHAAGLPVPDPLGITPGTGYGILEPYATFQGQSFAGEKFQPAYPTVDVPNMRAHYDGAVSKRDEQLRKLQAQHPELKLQNYEQMREATKLWGQDVIHRYQRPWSGASATAGGIAAGMAGGMAPRTHPEFPLFFAGGGPAGTVAGRIAVQGLLSAGARAASYGTGLQRNRAWFGLDPLTGAQIGEDLLYAAGTGAAFQGLLVEPLAAGVRALRGPVPPPRPPPRIEPAGGAPAAPVAPADLVGPPRPRTDNGFRGVDAVLAQYPDALTKVKAAAVLDHVQARLDENWGRAPNDVVPPPMEGMTDLTASSARFTETSSPGVAPHDVGDMSVALPPSWRAAIGKARSDEDAFARQIGLEEVARDGPAKKVWKRLDALAEKMQALKADLARNRQLNIERSRGIDTTFKQVAAEKLAAYQKAKPGSDAATKALKDLVDFTRAYSQKTVPLTTSPARIAEVQAERERLQPLADASLGEHQGAWGLMPEARQSVYDAIGPNSRFRQVWDEETKSYKTRFDLRNVDTTPQMTTTRLGFGSHPELGDGPLVPEVTMGTPKVGETLGQAAVRVADDVEKLEPEITERVEAQATQALKDEHVVIPGFDEPVHIDTPIADPLDDGKMTTIRELYEQIKEDKALLTEMGSCQLTTT